MRPLLASRKFYRPCFIQKRNANTSQKDSNIAHLVFTMQKMKSEGFLPDEFIYTKIISTLAQSKDVEHAEEYFHKMIADGLAPSEVNYSILINMYVSVNDFDKALATFERMTLEGLKADSNATYASLILGYARKGDFNGFLRLLTEAVDSNNAKIQPNNYQLNSLYSVLINACRVQKKIDTCHEIYEEMKKRDKMAIDPFLYALLVDSFSFSEESVKLEKSREIITRVETEKNFPTASTFLLMRFCAKESLFFDHHHSSTSSSYRFFEILLELYSTPKRGVPIISRRVVDTILKEMQAEKEKDEKKAENVKAPSAKLSDRDAQIKVVYTKAMNLYAMLNLSFETLDLFKRMIQDKLYPGLEQYRILITLYAKLGLARDLFGMMSRMKYESIQPDTYIYNVIIKMNMDRNDVGDNTKSERIIRQLKEMKEKANAKPNENTILLLKQFYDKTKDEAIKKELEEVGRENTDRTGRAFYYNRLLVDVKNKQSFEVKEAEYIFNKMKAEKVQLEVYTYTIMIDIYALKRVPHKAMQLYEEMMAAGFKAGLRTLNSILDVYAKSANEKKALAIIDQFSSENVQMNVYTYNAMMVLYHRLDRPNDALTWFNKLCEDSTCQPNEVSFNSIIDIFASRREFTVVEELLERMISKNVAISSVLCLEILSNCFHAKNLEMAEKFLHLTQAHNVKLDNAALFFLFRIWDESNQVKTAREYFEFIEKNGVKPSIDVVKAILILFQKRKMLNEFIYTLDKFKSLNIVPNDKYFLTIFSFTEFVTANFEKVKEYLREMKIYAEVTYGTFNLLLKIYSENGDQKSALQVLEMMQQDKFKLNPTLSVLLRKLAHSKDTEYSKLLLEKSSLTYMNSSRTKE